MLKIVYGALSEFLVELSTGVLSTGLPISKGPMWPKFGPHCYPDFSGRVMWPKGRPQCGPDFSGRVLWPKFRPPFASSLYLKKLWPSCCPNWCPKCCPKTHKWCPKWCSQMPQVLIQIIPQIMTQWSQKTPQGISKKTPQGVFQKTSLKTPWGTLASFQKTPWHNAFSGTGKCVTPASLQQMERGVLLD